MNFYEEIHLEISVTRSIQLDSLQNSLKGQTNNKMTILAAK